MSTEEAKLPAALMIVDTSSVYSFDKPVITIGRASDNDLVIDHSKVSRKHAEIRFEAGRFEIVDLGSTGGTYVNGIKVDRHGLSKGDVISLSNVHIVFGQDEFPAATSTSKYQPPRDATKAEEDTTVIYRRDGKKD